MKTTVSEVCNCCCWFSGFSQQIWIVQLKEQGGKIDTLLQRFKVLLRDLVRATEELSFLNVMNASQSVPTYSITLLLPLRFLFLKLKLVTGFAHSQRNKHANGGCVLRVCVKGMTSLAYSNTLAALKQL